MPVKRKETAMTRIWCVLATLACATAASAQTVGRTLSLDEAIGAALAHNRALQSAALSEGIAGRDVASARTRRLPVFGVETQVSRLLKPVDITFPKGAFGDFASIGPVPGTDATVTTPARATMLVDASVSQPLTQLVRVNLNVQFAEASREFERERVRAARLSVVNDVKRAYFGVLQTNSALEAAESNGRLLEELNRIVGNRVMQQVALRADGLEVQTRLAQQEVTMLTLRHSLASAKEQLNLLLGRDVRTDFEVAGVPPPSAAARDLDAARAQAIASRPDVKEAQLRVKQAELARRLARAEYIPDISLAVQSYSPVNINGAPKNISTVGVQLKWEPFDWGRKENAVASRSLELRQAGNALTDAEANAVIEIDTQFRKLEEARARLRVAALSRDTAEENTRVRVARYEIQAALLSDVLQSQAAYADATNQYQQALLSLLTTSADFEQALGEDETK
jgi:outer membrane protein TolC